MSGSYIGVIIEIIEIIRDSVRPLRGRLTTVVRAYRLTTYSCGSRAMLPSVNALARCLVWRRAPHLVPHAPRLASLACTLLRAPELCAPGHMLLLLCAAVAAAALLPLVLPSLLLLLSLHASQASRVRRAGVRWDHIQQDHKKGAQASRGCQVQKINAARCVLAAARSRVPRLRLPLLCVRHACLCVVVRLCKVQSARCEAERAFVARRRARECAGACDASCL